MRIIAVGTLKAFWDHPGHQDAEQPLRTWVRVIGVFMIALQEYPTTPGGLFAPWETT